jgi:predicted small lipoprotein YifL
VTDFPRNSSLRRAAALSLVLSLVILAAGCGRRGPLEPPATAAVTPTPTPTTGAEPTAALGHPKVAPIKPPKTPFVLDPLL